MVPFKARWGTGVKAWVVERFGSHDDLVLKDVPLPRATTGSVLVKVVAAGLNFADSIAVSGRYQVQIPPPFILGSEIAGEVVEARAGSGFSRGERVVAQVPAGAFAEYCAIEAARLIRLPLQLGFAQAAALPVSYTTAYVALLEKGALAAGETVLIHAAAGGVGIAATQVAKWRGARVIATAGSDEKCALAKANGADHVINYRDADWLDQVRALAPDGVDAVVDPVGGDVTLESLRLLVWGGRLLLIGFASGTVPALPANRLLVKAISAHGIFWSFERQSARIAEIQQQLVELCSAGALRPHIGISVPMADLKVGMAALDGGRTTGKVVMNVASA